MARYLLALTKNPPARLQARADLETYPTKTKLVA